MFRGRTFHFIFLCLWSIGQADAYTLTQTQNGQSIRWHYGQKYFLAGNPTNQSGISTSAMWSAVVNGLQQWKRATSGMFDFDYWQGTDPTTYRAKQEQDGVNTIFFASQSNQKTDPNVIGYTQVWFNARSGNLIEADILLNDRDYILTDSGADTSSKRDQGGKRVYLNNVVTHELGHALGLSHSNSINSTMLYVEFSEQFNLGCDDWSAAKHLYPTTHNGMGTLTGAILSPQGEPVPGAVVTAISLARGVPIASVLTDQNGNYLFGALEAGSFSLMVENYQGGTSSVPPDFRTKAGTMVCDEGRFPKNFVVSGNVNTLARFDIVEGVKSNAGAYRLRCEEVPESPMEFADQTPSAMVDVVADGTSKTYTFQASGPFKITGLAYLLLSPVKVSLSLVDASGTSSLPRSRDQLYRSKRSEYRIEDEVITGNAYGPVSVKVETSTLDLQSFPTPAVQPSSQPYFVLIFNDHPDASLSSALPDNARCSSDAPFENYASPASAPIRNSTTTSARDNIGFCGNANAASFHEGKRHSSNTLPSLGSLIGWALPFLAAIGCQLFFISRRSKMKE